MDTICSGRWSIVTLYVVVDFEKHRGMFIYTCTRLGQNLYKIEKYRDITMMLMSYQLVLLVESSSYKRVCPRI